MRQVTPRRLRTRGAVTVLVAIGLVVMLTAAAFVYDLGRVIVAAQQAQKTADAAALAGAGRLVVDQASASDSIANVVSANSGLSNFTFTQVAGSPVFYGAGAAVPAYRTLGGTENAVRVAVETDVQHYFGPIVGLRQTRVVRSAVAARLTAGGVGIAPIWISAATPMVEGQSMELHMSTLQDSNSTLPLPAGNFGWLEPQSSPSDFRDLLRGYPLPESLISANMVSVGDYVNGYPGQKVGNWSQSLGTAPNDLGRLDRAAEEPYASQTPDNYTADNPRIMLIPIVDVISGSGSQATYQVVRFAMFWLETVNGPKKSFTGQLLDGDVPGLPASDGGVETGVWTVKLVG